MNRNIEGEERDAVRRVDAELASEAERIRRLRAELDASDNVVRERVERHLEEAEMDLHDASAQLLDLPSAGSYERRRLEGSVRSLEFEIASVIAKLEAAEDEEAEDWRNTLRAERDALRAQAGVLAAQLGHAGPAPW
jgi:hypothetical protein